MKDQSLRSALAKPENEQNKTSKASKDAAQAVIQRAPQVSEITMQMREKVRLESRRPLGLIEAAREEIPAASTLAPELLYALKKLIEPLSASAFVSRTSDCATSEIVPAYLHTSRGFRKKCLRNVGRHR